LNKAIASSVNTIQKKLGQNLLNMMRLNASVTNTKDGKPAWAKLFKKVDATLKKDDEDKINI